MGPPEGGMPPMTEINGFIQDEVYKVLINVYAAVPMIDMLIYFTNYSKMNDSTHLYLWHLAATRQFRLAVFGSMMLPFFYFMQWNMGFRVFIVFHAIMEYTIWRQDVNSANELKMSTTDWRSVTTPLHFVNMILLGGLSFVGLYMSNPLSMPTSASNFASVESLLQVAFFLNLFPLLSYGVRGFPL